MGKRTTKRPIQHTRPDIRVLLRKLEHDREALQLVVRLIEKLAAKSRTRSRSRPSISRK